MNRCDSEHGSWRCVYEQGHDGCHVAPMVGNRGYRWGMVGIGCCDPECLRRANHSGPHRNGKGRSWVPIDEAEYDEFFAWQRSQARSAGLLPQEPQP